MLNEFYGEVHGQETRSNPLTSFFIGKWGSVSEMETKKSGPGQSLTYTSYRECFFQSKDLLNYRRLCKVQLSTKPLKS